MKADNSDLRRHIKFYNEAINSEQDKKKELKMLDDQSQGSLQLSTRTGHGGGGGSEGQKIEKINRHVQ